MKPSTRLSLQALVYCGCLFYSQASSAIEPATADIKLGDPRYVLEIAGKCESVLFEKPVDPRGCSKVMHSAHYVSGVHKQIFEYNETILAFVTSEPSQTNEFGDVTQIINRLEVKKPNESTVSKSAKGSCIRKKPNNNEAALTVCSVVTASPSERIEFAFTAIGGAKLLLGESVPTEKNQSVDILINAPAKMVAGVWMKGDLKQASQLGEACFRQATDLRSFYLLLQCTSISAAVVYLQSADAPALEKEAPMLPDAFLTMVRSHFERVFVPKDGKTIDWTQIIRSHYAGSVWAVRKAYGSTVDGYATTAPRSLRHPFLSLLAALNRA